MKTFYYVSLLNSKIDNHSFNSGKAARQEPGLEHLRKPNSTVVGICMQFPKMQFPKMQFPNEKSLLCCLKLHRMQNQLSKTKQPLLFCATRCAKPQQDFLFFYCYIIEL